MQKNFLYLTLLTLLPWNAVQAQQEDTFDFSETETDTVIEMPSGMMIEMDSLLEEWNNKNYLVVEGDCDKNTVDPEFTKEEFIHRLSRLPNVIEMPYNEVVLKMIKQYTGRLRHSTSIILGASNFYMPIFEEALEAYQLPLELKYLPVIESAMKPTATSRAGAVGLWQFMITTGKNYGLTVNSLIDERRDPVKSSYAAAHYLKDLYAIFGNWTLVIASYNCGPSNVRKAISRAGGKTDYWEIYPYLPSETRGYVPAFIATNYVMNYYCDHNICPARMSMPAATDTVVVTRDLHMEQVTACCNVSMEEVKALNPQYRTGRIPGEVQACTLRLPSAAIATFVSLGDSVYNYRREELLTNRKEVEVNETKSSSRSSSRGSSTITVRKGDNLGSIALRNGTTVAKLKALNGLKNNNIRIGQRLKVR